MLKLMRQKLSRLKVEPFYLLLLFYTIFVLVQVFMRHASADEAYYFKETALLSELIKKGVWFGDYGVGLHGFLFKMPVAVGFLILGKVSVLFATLFTVCLSIGSLIIFYKILKEYFLRETYALWSVALLASSLQFLMTTISFNRDIPALFATLLFSYLFLKKSNIWLIGLSLLLIFDAKEHVFLTIAPVYGLYLFLEFLKNFSKISIVENIKKFFINIFSAYIFTVIWVLLMFYTSVLPVNMFVASIFGLVESGLEWNQSQFSTEFATQNTMGDSARDMPLLYYSECDSALPTKIVCSTINVLNEIIVYVGKILYPRTFSFLSIPKIIAFPTIFYSFLLLKQWWKMKDKRYLFPAILLFNVLVMVLRASHGRYLLCVVPIFSLVFVLFLKDYLKKGKNSRTVLIATTIFVLFGLLFETTYIAPKIILEVGLLLLMWSIWFLPTFSYLSRLFLLGCVTGMFVTQLAFSFGIGQISTYLKYGYNMETKRIVAELDDSEKIWINDYGSGDLINVYRNNLFNNPEWNWDLADWLPKKSLLKVYSESNTYTSFINEIDVFQQYVFENQISKVVLVVSVLETEEFQNQKMLEEFWAQDWLEFERELELKNKKMYIFKIR